MAKRPPPPTLKNVGRLTQATEPAPTSTLTGPDDELPATGRTRAQGIGLKESEIAALDAIAAETGIAKNSLARFAVREFIKRYRRGEIDLASRTIEPPPAKKKLRM